MLLRRMNPHLEMRIDVGQFEDYLSWREHMMILFEVVKQPLHFPARRRRSDRQVPNPQRAA